MLLTTLAATTALAAATAQDAGAADPPTLDPRIDASRITELPEPPPLPEPLVLPLPPDHRVARLAEQVPMDAARFDRALDASGRAVAALLARQAEDGSWGRGLRAVPTDDPGAPEPVAVAVTALCLKALVQLEDHHAVPESARDAAVELILSARRPDGGFEGGSLSSYVTSVVVSALSALEEPGLRPVIRDATRWLQSAQWDEGEGLARRQDWYGGAGYGTSGRPDLSNTQIMLDALYDSGASPSEPAFERAVAFLARTQNLAAVNPAEWAGNDGGFVYTPANGGESMASEAAGEGRYGELLPEEAARTLRSYGSMTYAGFKSLLYAGLGADDVRVRAAFDWIRRHPTFGENPGMGLQGLFYYRHAAARALRVAQQVRIDLPDGTKWAWRDQLVDALLADQGPDGTWANDEPRWLENDPSLATAYALLALGEALKPVTFPDVEPEEDSR